MRNNELYGRIISKYGNLEAFAKEMGVTRTTISNKINKKTGLSNKEILSWCQRLNIEQADIGRIFFTKEV